MSQGKASSSVAKQPPQTAPPRQDKAIDHAREAERTRGNVQALELQRKRILSERTDNPHRRSALANALADVEEKLASLAGRFTCKRLRSFFCSRSIVPVKDR